MVCAATWLTAAPRQHHAFSNIAEKQHRNKAILPETRRNLPRYRSDSTWNDFGRYLTFIIDSDSHDAHSNHG